jgi:hypothetical protein
MSEKNIVQGFNENIEILLNEFVEEQKLQSKTTSDLVNGVNNLTGRFNKLEENIANRKEVSTTIDINPIKEILKKAITDIKMNLATHPKHTSGRIQILLFPEQDAKLFYKIVFGRWFLMIVVALFLQLSYRVIIHTQEIKKQIEIEAQKNDPVINAWDYLYNQNNKQLRKLMDSAFIRSKEASK